MNISDQPVSWDSSPERLVVDTSRPASTMGCHYVPAALSISEVLRYIFKYLDNADRATAACVCHTWVEVALDILWENLESAHPIMALLGPISFHEDGWVRKLFLLYALLLLSPALIT